MYNSKRKNLVLFRYTLPLTTPRYIQPQRIAVHPAAAATRHNFLGRHTKCKNDVNDDNEASLALRSDSASMESNLQMFCWQGIIKLAFSFVH